MAKQGKKILKATKQLQMREHVALDEKGRSLTDRERLFATIYAECLHPGVAYYKAGYTTAAVSNPRELITKGRMILVQPDVAALVAELFEQRLMDKAEISARLTDQARGGYTDYINERGEVDLKAMIADGKMHYVKSVRPGRYGNVVEFMDGQKALELLGRMHKLFVDRVESDGNVTVKVVYSDPLPDDPDA